MKTIWNKKTGEAREYEAVDAREILKNSDLYTDVDPKGGDAEPAGHVETGGAAIKPGAPSAGPAKTTSAAPLADKSK